MPVAEIEHWLLEINRWIISGQTVCSSPLCLLAYSLGSIGPSSVNAPALIIKIQNHNTYHSRLNGMAGPQPVQALG